MTEKFAIDKHYKTTYGQFRSECSSYWVNCGLMFFKKKTRTKAIDSKVGVNEVEASRLYTINECGWVEYPLIMTMMRVHEDLSTGAHKHKYFKT